MRVSVIIPTYKDWTRLQLCLDSLKCQSYPQSCFEIIVVNNDPSVQVPSELSIPINCRIIQEHQPGSYAARNAAIKVARGEIYAFTDSDCLPQKDWLKNGVDFLEYNCNYHRLGGKVELFSERKILRWTEVYEMLFSFPQDNFVIEQGMAVTANMFSRREVFSRVGLFDQNLMSGGDGEWGKRANAEGYEIAYLENCVVRHPTRGDLNDLIKKTRRMAGGHVMISSKKGRGALCKCIVKGLFPPFGAALMALKNNTVPLSGKCKALFLAYYLKLVGFHEKVSIVFFKKDVEKV